nr:hypothetical protein [Candidatus Baldrarchaeota archaeon]
MICGILLSLCAMYSIPHERHETGIQKLGKGEYYIINPPEINGIYFVTSSKLTINLYQNGSIELFIGKEKIIMVSYGNATNIIDLNCSINPVLVYVTEARDEIIIEYDYHVMYNLKPFAWLVIPAIICATLGTILTSLTAISILALNKIE